MGLINIQQASESVGLLKENIVCKKCFDFGVIHPIVNGKPNYARVVPCDCMNELLRRQRKEYYLSKCALPPKAKEYNFDNFAVFPEYKTAFEAAKELANESKNTKWLTLLGKVDQGKTHLAIAICKHWIERDKPARYVYVPDLLDEMRIALDNNNSKNHEYERKLDFYYNVSLLVLDDLGREHNTSWVQEKLNQIVDHRYMNDLPLVVTTNKTLDELSPQIASRLMRANGSKIIAMNGEEYALRKIKNDGRK
jgi:DNA replication protein DnaC